MRDQIDIPNSVIKEAFPAWEVSSSSRFGGRATSGRCFIYERKSLPYALLQIPVVLIKALWYLVVKIIAAFVGTIVEAAKAYHRVFVGEHIETVAADSLAGDTIYEYLKEQKTYFRRIDSSESVV